MRLNVEYLPLSKIKPDPAVHVTEHVKKLRNMMWDCMHIIVVKKNSKGHYSIVSGKDRFEYLRKHTKNKYAPCIIDENKITTEIKYWMRKWFHSQTLEQHRQLPFLEPFTPKSLSIIKLFLKQEPSFKKLNPFQKLKVLLIAVQYKKTTIHCMRLMMNSLHKKGN
ncbi:hypothetical protein [Bacillus sp. NEB1478]|uniref:hypothetical protein n=1 Tax=Bacillus sp. NEB1478 TaxID=3073816 RepID=UPI002872CF41|nr:hypothetical protein [Bacillus sp. NEB1478]WNB91293.1 hypothetical protein RGB74_15505 [Bacillus sp. NEB1478]